MPTVGHLLAIYRTRRDMQRSGITNPAPCVKRFCEELVERLEELDPMEDVDVIELPTDEAYFVAGGTVLATLPSNERIERELRERST